MNFKQNSDFHFNKSFFKNEKIKKWTKKPLFDFKEKKYLVQIAREIYSYKIKDMYIFGWRNIHLYTYRVNENSRVEHVSA